MEHYFRIDEKDNAIDSLRRAVEFLEKTKSDPLYWKWFIIAIHHATYHFMLLALQNTDQSGIWKELPKLGFLEQLKKDIWKCFGMTTHGVHTENPKNKLVGFLEAFKRIQEDKRMNGYINAKAFVAGNRHTQALTNLNNILRNNFAHYLPVAWSIEILFILETCSPVLEVVEFLVVESGRLTMSGEEKNTVQSDIAKMRLFFDDFRKANEQQ